MELQKNAIYRLKITDVAFGGEGIGKISSDTGDFVVFVPATVQNDIVDVRLTKIKKSFANGEVTNVVQPSPKRIQPRCKHFQNCGGCTLQYLPYEEQLRIKEKQVVDALERIGLIKNPPIQPIVGCASPWFYRNKMEYSFGETADGKLELGLHLPNRFADIFDLEECFLQSEESVKIVHSVREWARSKKLSPYNTFKKLGLLKSLIVREGKNTGERMVNLIVSGDEEFEEIESFAALFANSPALGVTSLYWTEVKIQRGHATRHIEHHAAGTPTITEKLSAGEGQSLSFEIHPQAFFQTNTSQAEILYREVLSAAEAQSSHVAYDLFCGTGTIGMFLAQKCRAVYGAEINEWAVKNARENAARNNIGNITFLCGDIGKIFNQAAEAERPDIVVIDPPRAGVAEKNIAKILEAEPAKIVYVSCNPATMARDVKILSAKYTLQTVRPIDMFPQTYHVETVCGMNFL